MSRLKKKIENKKYMEVKTYVQIAITAVLIFFCLLNLIKQGLAANAWQ